MCTCPGLPDVLELCALFLAVPPSTHSSLSLLSQLLLTFLMDLFPIMDKAIGSCSTYALGPALPIIVTFITWFTHQSLLLFIPHGSSYSVPSAWNIHLCQPLSSVGKLFQHQTYTSQKMSLISPAMSGAFYCVCTTLLHHFLFITQSHHSACASVYLSMQICLKKTTNLFSTEVLYRYLYLPSLT